VENDRIDTIKSENLLEVDIVHHVESLSLEKLRKLSVETLIQYKKLRDVNQMPPDVLRVIVSNLTPENAALDSN